MGAFDLFGSSQIAALKQRVAELEAEQQQSKQLLTKFVQAQAKMGEQHNDFGIISHKIDEKEFTGQFRDMAKNVNDMVQAHINVKMRMAELITAYSKGDFSQSMEVLPGEK